VNQFPRSDLVRVPLLPTISGGISNYLRLATQKIYINLPSGHDKIVTNRPLELLIRRVPTKLHQYVSPIAHQLAAKLGLTPLEVCQSLQSQVDSKQINNSPYLEMYSWYTNASYIYFQLTPGSISMWLDYIQDLPLKDDHPTKIAPGSPPSSLVLYAHARCCSLLRLARDQKLISLNQNWQMPNPEWLICDRDRIDNCATTDRILIFELPVEHQLIHAFMDVLDGISGDSAEPMLRERPQNWAKLALKLAQHWLEFDHYCQVFGDTKRQNPHLAIARCGLTAIARRYLQVLLEDYLGVTALVEL
jgi:hypothetical protein